jgi:hypothetical protein
MMRNLIFVWLAFFALAGCNSKSDSMTKEEMIAGESEKTWEAKKEANAAGDNDKLTREEKKERITFWRNGNVKMGDGNTTMSGQWTIEAANLRLHFAGENVTENFTVLELEKDKMKLKAGDGSELTMKPD